MTRQTPLRRSELTRQVILLATVVAILAVLAVDIATGLWQDVVILSGVVAGLLTFVLTALVLDQMIARAEHARWVPVTRLALTDIAHALADDERSEVVRGRIVPRALPDPRAGGADPEPAAVEDLLHRVVAERERVTAALGRWSAFLVASGDVRGLMVHVAALAERLDAIRDAALEVERDGGDAAAASRLSELVESFNSGVRAASAEISTLLAP